MHTEILPLPSEAQMELQRSRAQEIHVLSRQCFHTENTYYSLLTWATVRQEN